MTPQNSFDWKGFYFVTQILVALLLIITGARFGLPYAYAHFFSPPTTTNNAALVVADAPSSPPAPAPAQADTWVLASTSERVINALKINEVVPESGKFIGADLVNMKLYLYEDGREVGEYPILTKGKPGTPWETPSGFYNIDSKEENHFSSIGKVYMPYSMQFYGNYFIHGWPYYPDGTPVATSYSGGCIRLSTTNAAEVYTFAKKGTAMFVYDANSSTSSPQLALGPVAKPTLSATSFLVADIDTSDVYAEQDAQVQKPIASVTKLMTGLVANEIISFEQKIPVNRGVLLHPQDSADTTSETFLIGSLLYPLLMESNNAVADTLAHYYGSRGFVKWMNTTAKALDMQSTQFADPSGVSSDNISTPDDLYRLANYLANKKSFIFSITRTPNKTLTADTGNSYSFGNFNQFSTTTGFIGGKVGHTTPAQDTMVSVFSVAVGGVPRRVAIIVLDSQDYTSDTQSLLQWFTHAAQKGASLKQSACVSCTIGPLYRKIQL